MAYTTQKTLKITPTESVSIRRRTPELLELEVTWGPGAPPPAHLHPAHDESFEMLSGEIRVRIGGEERPLGAGDTLEVPRGTVHTMWNPGDEPARAVWQNRPAGRVEEWFRAIDALHRQGRVDKKGMPGPLAFATLLTEYRDVFQLAAGPRLVVRGALSALAVAGRARGYRPRELAAA